MAGSVSMATCGPNRSFCHTEYGKRSTAIGGGAYALPNLSHGASRRLTATTTLRPAESSWKSAPLPWNPTLSSGLFHLGKFPYGIAKVMEFLAFMKDHKQAQRVSRQFAPFGWTMGAVHNAPPLRVTFLPSCQNCFSATLWSHGSCLGGHAWPKTRRLAPIEPATNPVRQTVLPLQRMW